jgi:hypothetical protein
MGCGENKMGKCTKSYSNLKLDITHLLDVYIILSLFGSVGKSQGCRIHGTDCENCTVSKGM